nr:reverse transcriptase domain-containing protein [Tanacetum cinerariifolium]
MNSKKINPWLHFGCSTINFRSSSIGSTSWSMTEKLFAKYTGIKVKQFKETLLLHMGNVKKPVAERTRHKRQYDRRMKERQMQSRESKVVSSKALDASLVVTECGGTKSDEHITSSCSGTYITHVVDADIRPVNDQEPSAEVHLTAQHNVLANEQQHTDQFEPSYDTYLLEKKCVFNANHDDCITKFLKEVNSRAKVQSPKSRNNINPAKRIPNVIKPERWISKGYRWIPTGKIFTDCTTKVDSEPLNGSNDDITNPYEWDQTLNVSAGTLNLSAGTSFNLKKERLRVSLLKGLISQKPGRELRDYVSCVSESKSSSYYSPSFYLGLQALQSEPSILCLFFLSNEVIEDCQGGFVVCGMGLRGVTLFCLYVVGEKWEAIVVLPILGEHFELKHSLINMMTSDQFFGLEKDNPYDHIRWFNKITSTIKYKDVPNSPIKLMLFPFSLARAARRWLEKEPPHSILTWEDLVSKFINEFFPSSRMTNLRNEISNFQQRFDESFHEACDRYKDILRACPHHGFTELHQLDTFYNALNPTDQDSLNSAVGGNLLERRTQDVLTITENKSMIAKLTHAVNQQTSDVTTAMTAILKQFQETPPPASVKAVEEICVTCGGGHPYYQCLAADGNTFLEFQDNIQGYVSAAAVNYSQGNSGYRPSIVPLSELEKIKKMNDINMKAMQTQINNIKNELRNEMKNLIQASMSNKTNELKNMTASFFQMNTASTLGSKPLPSNTIANPKGELKAITTRSGLVLDGPTVSMPPPFLIWRRMNKMLKALLSTKEKLLELANTPLNENCSAVILKKLPEKRGDPGKFLIPCSFSELKCKALADLAKIAKDVFVSVGKFTFPADFVIVNYESDPRVLLILGKPFLRTARALIDVHGKEMILRDEVINPLSGSPSSSFIYHLLEEFTDEFALITFPLRNDDLPFDIESDLREIEYLLNHDPTKKMVSFLEDSVDECNLVNPNFGLVDTIPEMFNDEHTLDYSSPPLYDDFDDDLVELEPDNDDAYNDPFDSKEDKIKESKLLIDELDPPRSSDFFPSLEYDSILYEDFSEVDALLSTDNEDKVFNPGILIHENLSEVTIRVAPDKNVKKISSSNASLILKDFNPPLSDHKLPFHKEVLESETLLLFSSKIKEKFSNPRIAWILKTRARGFVLRSLDLHILSFILGIQYSNLID